MSTFSNNKRYVKPNDNSYGRVSVMSKFICPLSLSSPRPLFNDINYHVTFAYAYFNTSSVFSLISLQIYVTNVNCPSGSPGKLTTAVGTKVSGKRLLAG